MADLSIHWPMQVSGGGGLYAKRVGADKAEDMSITISMAPDPNVPGYPIGTTDEILIEGSASFVREALVRALAILDNLGAYYVERGELRESWADITPFVELAQERREARIAREAQTLYQTMGPVFLRFLSYLGDHLGDDVMKRAAEGAMALAGKSIAVDDPETYVPAEAS